MTTLMTPHDCILCDKNSHVTLLYPSNVTQEHLNEEIFSARRMPDRLHGNVFRCTDCGLTFTNPLIDLETLKKLYTRSTYTYGREEEHIRLTYERYLRTRTLPLIARHARPWSYLDIGCGNGFMLTSALSLGFNEVCGVEPSTDAIAKADATIRNQIIQGMFDASIVGENRFDVVTCFQALDHMPDPLAFARECLKSLKQDGVMLCINHNIGSLTARILGERCPMIDIEHTYLHTPKTMVMLFEQAGFTDIRVFSVRNDYPLRYWMRLVPMPKVLKNFALRLLDVIGIGGWIIPLSAGNLGMTARKP